VLADDGDKAALRPPDARPLRLPRYDVEDVADLLDRVIDLLADVHEVGLDGSGLELR
jgi:hypothetical protein